MTLEGCSTRTTTDTTIKLYSYVVCKIVRSLNFHSIESYAMYRYHPSSLMYIFIKAYNIHSTLYKATSSLTRITVFQVIFLTSIPSIADRNGNAQAQQLDSSVYGHCRPTSDSLRNESQWFLQEKTHLP